MDQSKIGRFIAQMRKEQSFTQRQLADRLGISDKTVSKWECGNGLPEVSLMLPLCAALEISVNELLSGERLDEAEYRRKAEENMMDLIREREENKRRFWLTFVSGMSALALFVMLFVLIAYSDWISPAVRALLTVAGLICFFGALVAVMEGERTIGWYKCGRCGEKFVPSFRQYLWGEHLWTKRRLRCPHCGQRCWCRKVMGRED